MPHSAAPPVSPGFAEPALLAGAGPLDVLARWPADVAVAAFLSFPQFGHAISPWLGRSILARPGRPITRTESQLAGSPDPLSDLRAALADVRTLGVAACLGYELGRVIEPAARLEPGDPDAPVNDRGHPAMVIHPAQGVLACDTATGAWTCAGATPALDRATDAAFALSPFTPTYSARTFQRTVARAIEYTHAGDCFQVNLAHRVSARFSGSPRALALHLFRAIHPALGSYIETPNPDGSLASAILSLSPELFLHVEGATGTVTSRPIKGTRAASDRGSDLERSEKDAAELAMIVDLMRNDLGRVCAPGSIRVDRARDVESFGRDVASGVRHTVATVSGTLGPGRTSVDLVAACFPPGSVTGAPKIRAMQIIEELEPVARGPYCGAIGWFGPQGDATLSVPIRTVVLTADPGSSPEHATGVLDLHIGAGIVADSDPAREWMETLHKAATILAPLGQDVRALDL